VQAPGTRAGTDTNDRGRPADVLCTVKERDQAPRQAGNAVRASDVSLMKNTETVSNGGGLKGAGVKRLGGDMAGDEHEIPPALGWFHAARCCTPGASPLRVGSQAKTEGT
jgi:hypothetical protein